jgi:hypothetical protein
MVQCTMLLGESQEHRSRQQIERTGSLKGRKVKFIILVLLSRFVLLPILKNSPLCENEGNFS